MATAAGQRRGASTCCAPGAQPRADSSCRQRDALGKGRRKKKKLNGVEGFIRKRGCFCASPSGIPLHPGAVLALKFRRGEAGGVSSRGPEVIPYAPGKRLSVWECCLLQTGGQVQRDGPAGEGSAAVSPAAAFPRRHPTRNFALSALRRAPSAAPHPRLAPCLRGALQSCCPWSLRAEAEGRSSSDTSELRVQAGGRWTNLSAQALVCEPTEIPPILLHTFPAHPPRGGSGRTSASEPQPPAFGPVSRGPAPGREQQLGHLRDTKGNSVLSRGGAGPQHWLWVAGCCTRSLGAR